MVDDDDGGVLCPNVDRFFFCTTQSKFNRLMAAEKVVLCMTQTDDSATNDSSRGFETQT